MLLHLQFPHNRKFTKKKNYHKKRLSKVRKNLLENNVFTCLPQQGIEKQKLKIEIGENMQSPAYEYFPQTERNNNPYQYSYCDKQKKSQLLSEEQLISSQFQSKAKQQKKYQFQQSSRQQSMDLSIIDFEGLNQDSMIYHERSNSSIITPRLSRIDIELQNQSLEDENISNNESLDLIIEESQVIGRHCQTSKKNKTMQHDLFNLSPISSEKEKKVKISQSQRKLNRQQDQPNIYSEISLRLGQKLFDEKVAIKSQFSKQGQVLKRKNNQIQTSTRQNKKFKKDLQKQNVLDQKPGENLVCSNTLNIQKEKSQPKLPLHNIDFTDNQTILHDQNIKGKNKKFQRCMSDFSQQDNCNLLGEKLLILNERKNDQNLKALEQDLSTQQHSFQKKLQQSKILNKANRSRLSLDQSSLGQQTQFQLFKNRKSLELDKEQLEDVLRMQSYRQVYKNDQQIPAKINKNQNQQQNSKQRRS